MISTSGMLIRALEGQDDFITVRDENGGEYIIESFGRVKEYYDSPSSHLCLNIRKVTGGNILR